MATFSKTILSGSTDGRPIAVAATSSPGTTIHTGSSTAADLHEVWLYATNYGTNVATLSVQWGGTTSADDIDVIVDPTSGLQIVAPGLIIKGNATPLVIRAFATVASTVNITGYVNVIA